MQIGVIFPTLEIGNDPRVIRDYAQTVEGLGYHHILVVDHVAGVDRPDLVSAFGPMTADAPIHEPLTLLAYLAACTKHIELVTGVLVLPQRQTVLVAKQAAEVDVLSGGRLRLGIGVGWVEPEFVMLNEDYHTRGARIEEQLAVLRVLWTERAVTYHGRWHQLENAGISPPPIQRPIPLWLGGFAERSLRRTARIGDGWIGLGEPDEGARALLDRLHGYVVDAGRSPEEVGTHILLIGGAAGDKVIWAERVEGWRQLGARYLSIDTMRAGLATPQEHINLLSRMKSVLSL